MSCVGDGQTLTGECDAKGDDQNVNKYRRQ